MARVITYGTAALAMALASCASDTSTQLASPGTDNVRQCFRLEQARSVTYEAESGLKIDAGLGRTYQADVEGPCPDIARVSQYALIAEAGRNREICVGDTALVQPKELNQTTAPYACRIKVNSVTR